MTTDPVDCHALGQSLPTGSPPAEAAFPPPFQAEPSVLPLRTFYAITRFYKSLLRTLFIKKYIMFRIGRMPVDLDAAVLVGSVHDLEKLRPLEEIFQTFGIRYWVEVASAHRAPERVAQLVKKAEDEGAGVLVAAAGLAAHLAGAAAARTLLPVIGLPLVAGSLGGLDALLATVQMPKGVPVATVAIDSAANAAYLAVEILALRRPSLREKLREERRRWEGGKG